MKTRSWKIECLIKFMVPALFLGSMSVVTGGLWGCSGNSKPVLNEVGPQTATVGVEMVILIEGRDADGDMLGFSLSVDTLPDINDRVRPPRFEPFGGASAYLRWTPLVADVGEHEFKVRASDGSDSATIVFPVTVQTGDAVPVFRKPLGSGTTLDLSQVDCVELDVLVDDADSPHVDIYLEEPIEDGYILSQDGAMEAIFNWCPTNKQVDAAERYTLNLAADDRDGHIARKKYVLVIRRKLEEDCLGQPPEITHNSPGALETVQDLELTATITDDVGLSGLPLLYYSLQQPANPSNPDFSQFVQVIMNRTSGDSNNGQYVGVVPNPVLTDSPGTTKKVYYFFEATDNDEDGGCRTKAPSDGVYSLDVTHGTGSSTGQPTCGTCGSDIQCSEGALCIVLGGGQSFCLPTCDGGGGCSSGMSCSDQPIGSVDGTAGRVCIPDTGSCTAECIDDVYEGNHYFDVYNLPVLDDGFYSNLKLCGDSVGGIDEDFFVFELTEHSFATVTLLFSHDEGDIDLSLYDEDSNHIASSYSVTDNEVVSECLDPGVYVINVYTFSSTINVSYDLSLTIPGGGCCVNDVHEPDNGPNEAHEVADSTIFDEMQICVYDEDWYAIYLDADDILVVDLLFDQTNPYEDLDLYLYDRDGLTLLSTWEDGGQSGNSDERLEYTVPVSGTYYVVVDGFMDSENNYMVGFEVQ